MSNFKIQGNASGSGTTTIQTGNTNADTTYTLPTADGTTGQALVTNGSGVLSFATVGSGDVTAAGNNAFTGANTFYNSTGQTFGTGTSTQDGIKLTGRAGGSSSYRVTFVPATLSASRTLTLPDADGTIATTATAVSPGKSIALAMIFGF